VPRERASEDRASEDIVSVLAHQWGWCDGSAPLGRIDRSSAVSCLIRSPA
jgi:hypothetical protein